RRREGRLWPGPDGAGLEDYLFRRDVALLEDLRPAVAEPAVADHQAFLAGGELPRHRFHAVGATARHDDRRPGAVDLLQRPGDIPHDLLEGLRHVVERAVVEHHRIFEQAV